MSTISYLCGSFPRLLRTVRLTNSFIPVPPVYFSSKYEKEFKQYNNSATSEELVRKKKPMLPKITLIISDNVTVTTLPEAQKLSKRRDLKLVKIMDLDTKTQRPLYKMMTGAEYHLEDLKQREQKKLDRLTDTSIRGEKVLMLTDNISVHDINTHANKIVKWIAKKFEVRIVINGNTASMEKAEKVYSNFEDILSDNVRFVQKRIKGSDIKFQVIPPKRELSTDSSASNNGNKGS